MSIIHVTCNKCRKIGMVDTDDPGDSPWTMDYDPETFAINPNFDVWYCLSCFVNKKGKSLEGSGKPS
jgi:hypothetical protein